MSLPTLFRVWICWLCNWPWAHGWVSLDASDYTQWVYCMGQRCI